MDVNFIVIDLSVVPVVVGLGVSQSRNGAIVSSKVPIIGRISQVNC